MKRILNVQWDSDFYKLRIGRFHYIIDYTVSDQFENFDLIYLSADHPLTKDQMMHLFGVKSFIVEHHEIKLDFLYNEDLVIDKIDERLVCVDDSPDYFGQLVQLGIASGIYSRFRLSPSLALKFEKLYTLWVQKSLSGVLADSVYAFIENNNCLGFVTLKQQEKNLTIGLIAVDIESRGKGIGSKLLHAVRYYARSVGCKSILVSTQGDNLSAIQFYLKNGFHQSKKINLYHIRNENPI